MSPMYIYVKFEIPMTSDVVAINIYMKGKTNMAIKL